VIIAAVSMVEPNQTNFEIFRSHCSISLDYRTGQLSTYYLWWLTRSRRKFWRRYLWTFKNYFL